MKFNLKFKCRHKHQGQDTPCGNELSAVLSYMEEITCDLCETKWLAIHILKTVNGKPMHYAKLMDTENKSPTAEVAVSIVKD